MKEPTQSELAELAARLATGEEVMPAQFRLLAERALALWDGAGAALRGRQESRGYRDMIRESWATAFQRAELELPEAGRFFTFPEALAYLMPKRRDHDRMKKLRDYLKAEAGRDPLAFLQSPEKEGDSVKDRAAAEIERLRERGFQYGQFCRFAERFLPWLESDKSAKRAEAGRTGGKRARATAKKKSSKRKKPL